MRSHLFVLIALGCSLSSCSKIYETMDTLENNRMAVDVSTQTIMENTRAIEDSNRTIEENRRQLEKINAALKKAGES